MRKLLLPVLLSIAMPAVAASGSSVRVAFDAKGIMSARHHGHADPATGRKVTIDDPVRVASISKLVVSIAVMRLVEDGRLDLDADISQMLGYTVRNPAYPDVPVTLRLLLSHQSSIVDRLDYALPLDRTMQAALTDRMAGDGAHAPGRYWRYANLNFGVVASVMERATGERFDQLMARLVFTPLRMDACFNWTTCSDRAIAHAVVLTGPDGKVLKDDLGGKRPECPVVPAGDGSCDLGRWRPGLNGAMFSPQGGLRISMRDLARLGRLLLQLGQVDGVRLLAPASVALIETPNWTLADGIDGNGDTDAGFYCRYGIGVQLLATKAPGCHDDLFGDGRQRIGHAGDAYGLRAGLWIDRPTGTGVAYFATAVDPKRQRSRHSAFTRVEESLAKRP